MPECETRRRIPSTVKEAATDPATAARRCIAALPIALTLAIFLGCMSLNFGGTSPETASAEVLVQKGTLRPSGETEQDVFYPVPYASPPNLTLDDMFAHDFVIVDQQPDHFRVRYAKAKPLLGLLDVEWTAKGVRATAIKAPGDGAAAQ